MRVNSQVITVLLTKIEAGLCDPADAAIGGDPVNGAVGGVAAPAFVRNDPIGRLFSKQQRLT